MGSHKNHQRYVQKVLGILARPNVTLASIKLKPSESILTILVLYMMVLIKGLLELNYMGERDRMGWLIIGSAFGLVAAWFGLTTLFHFVARILGGSGSYKNTLLLMGYIAVPMIITSFLSLLVYIISPLIMPEWSGAEWGSIHTAIGWVGMIWSWPGILCFYVLRYGEDLSSRRASIFVGIVMLVTIVGWFFPTLVPGLFGGS